MPFCSNCFEILACFINIIVLQKINYLGSWELKNVVFTFTVQRDQINSQMNFKLLSKNKLYTY